ncbi:MULTISPECIES: VacJ family lipoprotein [Pseudomonadaceae]|jgi:phospholipid-binding lipoprotein MlaA|uniref:Phospholipid-binding lipoprotein MlaA n=1 Tax=Ectopseudomonas alcaliphila TaxID=101564 RepID=A0A1G7J3W0_9GAMM|nr:MULTISPECIES: VacJ family lipoprotein [Pseudomonas]MDP9941476.1 phospholipid-binding lipoprotein MlaA [Pseudomonas sp. 3400]MDR7013695.1 phospholipid-binding lipoprotein MlaA [Pseudomonas alcaliphila]MDX5995335.1 VacJ family lipoprotein [Pseudomonas alcaliphila]SDF19573.1 phospholipid-binding lipoprotein MlaA [Pseudomonas alcaliphila]
MHVIVARWIARLGGLMALAGLSLLPAMSQAASEEDPWESFNRPIFRFNDTVDTYALKPIAQGYRAVTPQFLEDGVHNVFGNIGDVGNLANNLLQGKLHNAGVDTGRLIFNTTFGLLGFFDVAKHMGLRKNDEDFGQTLGVWGLDSGPYLVIPLLGPSTVRDATGRVPDSFLTPYPYMDHVPTRNVTRGVQVVDTRANLLQAERLVSGDKYIFIRNAYLQSREFKVKDGQVEDDF